MLSLIPDNYYPCEVLPLECSVLAGTSCSTRGSVMPQDTLHAPDVPDAASMWPRFDHIMRRLTTWAQHFICWAQSELLAEPCRSSRD